jgi:SAM-dependent methyltransferase
VAAQAFHWAEPRKALPELRRVLRAGGWFTVFWNDRDMDGGAILRQTQQLIQELVPGFDEAYRARDWAAILTSTGDFDAVRAFEYRHVVSMSRERYLMLWRSHNRLSAAAGATLNELLRRIERMVEREGVNTVEVPYVCRAWSVRRRD